MRQLDSGAWIKLHRAYQLDGDWRKRARRSRKHDHVLWRERFLLENKLKPGDLYVELNRYDPWGVEVVGKRYQKITTKQRLHVRPRHELLPLDYDLAHLEPLEDVLKELEAHGCRTKLRVSSMRDGHPHLHVWIACSSYGLRLYAEALVTEKLDRKMIRTHGISVPGFAGKLVQDGVRYVYNDVVGDFDAIPTYDRRQRELMRVHEGTNLDLLIDLRDWLRQVPRWDLPAGTTLYGEDFSETRSTQRPCPVDTLLHEGEEYLDYPWVRRRLGLAVDGSGLTTPVSAPVEPEALPVTLIPLLDKDVPAPQKQAYDAYEPDEAGRNGWAIMCVARQVGISAERLWQERHRPGMKHFRSRQQLEREYARVDATSTRGGDRRLAWALAAQQDDRMTVFEKRFVLHIAVRKHLVFGYGSIADAIGCSKMQITHMMRNDNVLKYVRKSGKIIKPGEGREAQTFEIVDPPESVEASGTLHSGTYGGICCKMAELRMAKLRWWDVLPTGETVLDAVTRLGGVQELAKEQQLAIWKLRVEDQRRTLARQRVQERYYKHLDEVEADRASRRWQRQLEREIALHKNPRRVDDSIMHRFRQAA